VSFGEFGYFDDPADWPIDEEDSLKGDELGACHRLSCQKCSCGLSHKVCEVNHSIRELELLQIKEDE
jgi:hypothetical protein